MSQIQFYKIFNFQNSNISKKSPVITLKKIITIKCYACHINKINTSVVKQAEAKKVQNKLFKKATIKTKINSKNYKKGERKKWNIFLYFFQQKYNLWKDKKMNNTGNH